tara:strand:- start:398 stop:1111 length:714 start_codon:yes stop_codon:yes gene_type:complete
MNNIVNKYGIELNSIEEALIDLNNGKPIILLDNPGREGEGDFIISASKVSVEWMNFILLNARGAFIAVFMSEEQANYFDLPAQVNPNDNYESSKTNFRLTCDTAYGHSGCSAHERAQTANILGGIFKKYDGRFHYNDQESNERKSTPKDLVRPGHIVPIVANPKGLHARQGHTESGVELMRMAGIDPPVAVDMEILAPDGSMGSVNYIYNEIAKPNDIKVISVGKICEKLGIEEKNY